LLAGRHLTSFEGCGDGIVVSSVPRATRPVYNVDMANSLGLNYEDKQCLVINYCIGR